MGADITNSDDRGDQGVAKPVKFMPRQHQHIPNNARREFDSGDVPAIEIGVHKTSLPAGGLLSQLANTAGCGAVESHWARRSVKVNRRFGMSVIVSSGVTPKDIIPL